MGQIRVETCEIEGIKVLIPEVFGDERGYFMETYRKDQFTEAGISQEFVQDNQSASSYGVLRGLHFQKEFPQDKLVRVIEGEVFDVAVDVRPGSPTYGQWVGVTLSSEKKNMFYVPEGFAHGFLVLSDTAEFVYKCTDVYDPASEGGVPWNDPTIAVEWPKLDIPYKTSEKDGKHEPFKTQEFSWAEKWR
jgi:dTDP-4-dehydrorhamnose 3,5-epimerase